MLRFPSVHELEGVFNSAGFALAGSTEVVEGESTCKLVTVEDLRTALEEADYFAKINEDDLVIDNTSLDADQVAQAIASAFQLNEP